MGFSKDYNKVPDWVEKPEGYQVGSMVKYHFSEPILSFEFLALRLLHDKNH